MIKLFAHRGFVTGNILQNSIASLKNAYDFGFRAIEFDIWFLEQELFLKHDRPKIAELNNLPKFKEYFLFNNHFEYWLDFKNLDEENVDEILRMVKKNIDECGINLEQVYFAPFITNYTIVRNIIKKFKNYFGEKVNFVAVCEELKNINEVKILREFLSENKIKFLSIDHKLINQDFVKLFSDIEIFAWTVNEKGRLEELENLGIKNFATDKLSPA